MFYRSAVGSQVVVKYISSTTLTSPQNCKPALCMTKTLQTLHHHLPVCCEEKYSRAQATKIVSADIMVVELGVCATNQFTGVTLHAVEFIWGGSQWNHSRSPGWQKRAWLHQKWVYCQLYHHPPQTPDLLQYTQWEAHWGFLSFPTFKLSAINVLCPADKHLFVPMGELLNVLCVLCSCFNEFSYNCTTTAKRKMCSTSQIESASLTLVELDCSSTGAWGPIITSTVELNCAQPCGAFYQLEIWVFTSIPCQVCVEVVESTLTCSEHTCAVVVPAIHVRKADKLLCDESVKHKEEHTRVESLWYPQLPDFIDCCELCCFSAQHPVWTDWAQFWYVNGQHGEKQGAQSFQPKWDYEGLSWMCTCCHWSLIFHLLNHCNQNQALIHLHNKYICQAGKHAVRLSSLTWLSSSPLWKTNRCSLAMFFWQILWECVLPMDCIRQTKMTENKGWHCTQILSHRPEVILWTKRDHITLEVAVQNVSWSV